MAGEIDETGGLYEGLPPDATVDSIEEDSANPGWALVSFSDGRKATLPTETALAMPQTPQAPPTSQGYPGEIGPPEAPMGPPAPPPADPAAAAPPPVPVGFTPVPAIDPSARPDVVPAGPMVVRGDSFRPAGALPDSPLGVTPAAVGTGVSDVPPPGTGYDAIVRPATAGGSAPFSSAESTQVSSTETADSPEEMQARLAGAVEADARSAYERDLAAYDASVSAKHTAAAGLMEQEAQLQRQRREHELLQQEHARIIKGIDENPIDEDGFWTAQPGRRAAAWIALALSGFLQGVTRGANPMLNQMMGALQGAQDSWLRNQQAQRDSVLRRRTAAMGDERAAMASLDMQLNGIMTKYVQLQADAAGVPPPPGLATYVAERQLRMVEKQNEIGRIAQETVTHQTQSEQRATPAQPALRRGDVVLQELGLNAKAIQSAWDPKDGNVPGAVDAATRLDTIRQELAAIKAKYDGLPQQNRISWSGVGLEGVAARMGSEAAKDQVRANALISEAQLMLKQASGNTKLFDSNQEREDLLRQLDTREPETTMLAIDTIAQRANAGAIAAAQRYTRDPQGLIDFIRESRGQTRGVATPEQPAVSRTLRGPASPGPAPAPSPSGGADAAGPLPPSPAVPASRAASLEAIRRALRQ